MLNGDGSSNGKEISDTFRYLRLDSREERKRLTDLAKLGQGPTPENRYRDVLYTRNNTDDEDAIGNA